MNVLRKRPFGRRGLEVTEASYGGGSLGNFYRTIDNRSAREILENAWEGGIRYFDTAPVYGRGRSERRIGQFLEEKPRDSYVLSTKVGRLLYPVREADVEQDGIFFNPSPFNFRYDYGYDGIMRSYEQSLHRLGLDRVDILYVHDIGRALHGDDAGNQLRDLKQGGLKALEELRGAGDIRGYGLGVIEVDACLDCLDYGDPDGFLLASCFTLLEQTAARPLLEKCLEKGVSIVAGGIFNSGILATGPVPGAHYNYGEPTETVIETVRKLETVCRRHGVKMSDAALQFPLSHPTVSTVLLGSGTGSSLEKNLKGLGAPIPSCLWNDLEAEGLLDPELKPQ